MTQDQRLFREWLKLWRPIFYGKPVEPEDIDELVGFITSLTGQSEQIKSNVLKDEGVDKQEANVGGVSADVEEKQEAWIEVAKKKLGVWMKCGLTTGRADVAGKLTYSLGDEDGEVYFEESFIGFIRSLLAHQREEIAKEIIGEDEVYPFMEVVKRIYDQNEGNVSEAEIIDNLIAHTNVRNQLRVEQRAKLAVKKEE